MGSPPTRDKVVRPEEKGRTRRVQNREKRGLKTGRSYSEDLTKMLPSWCDKKTSPPSGTWACFNTLLTYQLDCYRPYQTVGYSQPWKVSHWWDLFEDPLKTHSIIIDFLRMLFLLMVQKDICSLYLYVWRDSFGFSCEVYNASKIFYVFVFCLWVVMLFNVFSLKCLLNLPIFIPKTSELSDIILKHLNINNKMLLISKIQTKITN